MVYSTYSSGTPWQVDLHDEFVREFRALEQEVQDELLAHIQLLEQFGPQLGRPRADALKGSKHANMKELRFDAADGVWRFAFAFDPNRQAIVLCGGDKSGVSSTRFYQRLIDKVDARFDTHIATVKSSHATNTKGRKQRPHASEQSRAHSKGAVPVPPQENRRARPRPDR
jgi:hypothetical protein